MRALMSLIVATGAACGSVQFDSPDGGIANDAGVDTAVVDGMELDAWTSHCAPAAPITSIEDNHPAYGSTCIHGSWSLSAATGTTVPSTSAQANVAVSPMAITPGTNPLDPASTFVVHVSGSGQANTATVFGYATVAASLNSIAGLPSGTVDASAYTGIQFTGKITAGALGIQLGIANLYTDPVGGLCGVAGAMSCYDDPSAPLAVGAGWTTYRVPFDQLAQRGFGNPSPVGASFPRDHITRLNWLIIVPQTGPTEPWDLVIDDVTFY